MNLYLLTHTADHYATPSHTQLKNFLLMCREIHKYLSVITKKAKIIMREKEKHREPES